MRRSKKRKAGLSQSIIVRAPVASAVLLALSPAHAQEITGLGEVIVTAQKRSESLQDVPLSIQAIGTRQLDELHIANFADYAKFLPSLSYQSGGQSGGPGFSRASMRGITNGGDGNHSGSQPSVGTYLDEQPVTTINGALDVHIYDIERVEVLAGPQGTLYGASSQSGTIRIISNKPDPSGFAAGYNLEGSTIAKGDTGYLAEGFVNLPISDTTAIRLVGWARRDAGFIDNVSGTVTYPTSGVTKSNAGSVEKDYNDGDVYGGRAALKIDLNDSWAITASAIGQKQTRNGSYGYRSNSELTLTRFNPETSKDRWVQAALTIEGKLGNFDVTYAGAYLNRKDETRQDYVDYSYYYDSCCGYGAYIYDEAGAYIDPTQYILGQDRYTKHSHELRISSPAENRFRFVAGLFTQRQTHDIEQDYKIDGIAQRIEVTGWDDTWWLTQQVRKDRDEAIFGELTFDLTDSLSVTGGVRFFEAKNSLLGFFGFGLTNPFFPALGEPQCFSSESVNGGPCTNVDKGTKDSGNTTKLSLTYRFDDERLVYATFSEGYRPGGVNRRGSLPPYSPDFLTNYEIGWKTSWADNRLRFNGALFRQEWDDFQYSFLGQNSLTQIANAGQARVDGLEGDLLWAATDNLRLSAGFALLDAKLTQAYCGQLGPDGRDLSPCPDPPQAPKGARLPVSAKLKANITARYTFDVGGFDAHVQGAMVYVGNRWPDMRTSQRTILGKEPSYTIVDFAAGIAKGGYTAELFVNNVFDKRAQLDRWAQCDAEICGLGGAGTYITPTAPRTIGIRFGQRF